MRIRSRFFFAFLITGLGVVLTTALLAAAGFNRGLEQYLAERTCAGPEQHEDGGEAKDKASAQRRSL